MKQRSELTRTEARPRGDLAVNFVVPLYFHFDDADHSSERIIAFRIAIARLIVDDTAPTLPSAEFLHDISMNDGLPLEQLFTHV